MVRNTIIAVEPLRHRVPVVLLVCICMHFYLQYECLLVRSGAGVNLPLLVVPMSSLEFIVATWQLRGGGDEIWSLII